MKKPQSPRKPAGKQARATSVPTKSGGPKSASRQDLSGAQRTYIAELVELLHQHDLTELEMERDGIRVRVRRDFQTSGGQPAARESATPAHVAQPEPSVTASQAADTAGAATVTSPIVGTFYRSPSPDADPYVEEGDLVKKGQVLCIVEAMKLMNEIESELDGRIVKILAESTKPVEYGQPLFLIAPTPTS